MNADRERSGFYLTLSRAFLAPRTPAAFEGFRFVLAEDLDDYGRALGYPIADTVGFFARTVESLRTQTELLQLYSGLFLQPPRPASLNASLHLDGAIMGRSTDAIERAYARHGLARAEDFGDTPDHLSAQLEFLACLYDRAAQDAASAPCLIAEAQDFIRTLLLPWVPLLVGQLREAVTERAMPPVYLHLADVLQEALTADAGEIPDEVWRVIDPERAAARRAQEREMVHCRECGVPIAPAGRVRRVRKVLEKQGVDASHLDLCIDCRGAPKALLAQLTSGGAA
jgi:TorA maturation chaperone TorD